MRASNRIRAEMGTVALVSNAFAGPNGGGTEWLGRAIACASAANGHDVRWIACTPIPQDEELTRLRVARYRYDPTTSAAPLNGLLELCDDARAVHFMHFAKWGTDAVTALSAAGVNVTATLTDYNVICPDHQLFNRSTLRTCDAGGLAECALICQGFQPSGLQRYRRRNAHALNTGCSGIWCQTPHQRKVLTEYGLQPSLIADDRAHYFIPPEWSELVGTTRHDRFLYIGRCSEEKGLRLLWDVFAAHPEYSMDVVWDTDDLKLQAELISCVPENVCIHGSVPLEDLGPYLVQARALLLPSQWWENHATVIDYAYALGTPVVASSVPSLTHLCQRGSLTLVTPPGNPSAWIQALQRLAHQQPGETDMLARSNFQAAFGEMIEAMDITWFTETRS
jgi:glycosyltransferase involved in cell wall biosynthesis